MCRPKPKPSNRRRRGELTFLWLAPALLITILSGQPAAADVTSSGGLEIEISDAVQAPCPDQAVKSRNLKQANLCFTAPPTASLALRLAAPEAMKSISISWRFSAGGTGKTTSFLAETDRRAWTSKLGLPRTVAGSQTSPESTEESSLPTAESLLQKSNEGPVKTGHYLIDVAAGRHIAVVGLSITAAATADPLPPER